MTANFSCAVDGWRLPLLLLLLWHSITVSYFVIKSFFFIKMHEMAIIFEHWKCIYFISLPNSEYVNYNSFFSLNNLAYLNSTSSNIDCSYFLLDVNDKIVFSLILVMCLVTDMIHALLLWPKYENFPNLLAAKRWFPFQSDGFFLCSLMNLHIFTDLLYSSLSRPDKRCKNAKLSN